MVHLFSFFWARKMCCDEQQNIWPHGKSEQFLSLLRSSLFSQTHPKCPLESVLLILQAAQYRAVSKKMPVGFFLDNKVSHPFLFGWFVDGLARAEVSRAADAHHTRCICSNVIRDWLFHRFIPDNAANLRWWCGFDHVAHCSQLALLQPPSTELAGSHWNWTSSKATAVDFEEEIF